MAFFDFLPWRQAETFALPPASQTALARTSFGVSSLDSPVAAKSLAAGIDSTAASSMKFMHLEPTYNAGLQKIADHVAQVPPVLYEWKRENEDPFRVHSMLRSSNIRERQDLVRHLVQQSELVEVSRHPILDLINHPTPGWTGGQFWGLWTKYIIHSGESIVLKMRNGKLCEKGVPPTTLKMFPPHWCTKLPDGKTDRAQEYTFSGLSIKKAPTDSVWISRRLDPLDPYGRGLGLGKTLANELSISIEAGLAVKAAMENRALPDYHVKIAGKSTQEDKERITRKLTDKFRSIRERGANMVTGDNVSIEKISHTMTETGAQELREQSRDFILSFLGVPREMLGLTKDSNRATSATAESRMASGCTAPMVDFLRGQLQEHIAPLFGKRYVVDFRHPTQDDKTHKLNVMRSAPTGTYTEAEWRAESMHGPKP